MDYFNNIKININTFDSSKIDKRTILFVIIGFIVLFSLTLWYVLHYQYQKAISPMFCKRCFSTFNNIPLPISYRINIPHTKLLPSTTNSFSFTFSIYISNWYTNVNVWKHVFHRGSEIDSNCITSSFKWSDIPKQSPGVWLFPNVNDMRIVLNTNHISSYSCSNNDGSDRMEYVDIPNIPIGTWTHFTLSVVQNKIEVYMDGDLSKTTWLSKNPEIVDDNVYFGVGNNFSGYISNFFYVPDEISIKTIHSFKQYQKRIEKQSFNMIL